MNIFISTSHREGANTVTCQIQLHTLVVYGGEEGLGRCRRGTGIRAAQSMEEQGRDGKRGQGELERYGEDMA